MVLMTVTKDVSCGDDDEGEGRGVVFYGVVSGGG